MIWPFKRRRPLPKYMQRPRASVPSWIKSGVTLLVGAAIAVGTSAVTTTISGDQEAARNEQAFLREQRVSAYANFISALNEQDTLMADMLIDVYLDDNYIAAKSTVDADTIESGQELLSSLQTQISVIGSEEAVEGAEAAVMAHWNASNAFQRMLSDSAGAEPDMKDPNDDLFTNFYSAINCSADGSTRSFSGVARNDLGGSANVDQYREEDCPDLGYFDKFWNLKQTPD